MLIIALVLAVIGLAALVFAVVTSSQLVAWVCIAASVVGVVLLIIDALQERQRRQAGEPAGEPVPASTEPGRASGATGYTATGAAESGTHESFYADYPEDAADEGGEAAGGAQLSTRRPESGIGRSDEPAVEADQGTTANDDTTR